MPTAIVRVVGAADGTATPHDGCYVVRWNPHTKAGILELTSTDEIVDARRFDLAAIHKEWRMVSRVQPKRPWDHLPNRPLTGINLEIIKVD